jgi:hypothetical protein
MPLSGHCLTPAGSAQEGGYLPLAPGVSTVRYPIPQRTFKYAATVQSVTDETRQLRTFSCHPGYEDQKRSRLRIEATACRRSPRLLEAAGVQLPQIGGNAFSLAFSGQGQA